MPNKPKQEVPQDDILGAFTNAKEDKQLDLLEITEELQQTPAPEAPVVHEVKAPEPMKQKMHEGADGEWYTDEEWKSPVMANGPTREEVEGWKARYKDVFFVPYSGKVYVFRALRRPEYREIIRDQTLTALDREEHFTERCVLYPYNFSIEAISQGDAGVPSLLSEMIMDKSGFVAQSAPIKL